MFYTQATFKNKKLCESQPIAIDISLLKEKKNNPAIFKERKGLKSHQPNLNDLKETFNSGSNKQTHLSKGNESYKIFDAYYQRTLMKLINLRKMLEYYYPNDNITKISKELINNTREDYKDMLSGKLSIEAFKDKFNTNFNKARLVFQNQRNVPFEKKIGDIFYSAAESICGIWSIFEFFRKILNIFCDFSCSCNLNEHQKLERTSQRQNNEKMRKTVLEEKYAFLYNRKNTHEDVDQSDNEIKNPSRELKILYDLKMEMNQHIAQLEKILEDPQSSMVVKNQ